MESGTITNRSGGTIYGYYGIRIAPGGNATVTNAGTIASTGGYYGAGVGISGGTLSLTNQPGGAIYGGAFGVAILSGARGAGDQ